MRRLLAHRDQHLGLHLEAAHYLHHLAPLLQRTFPDARFIATVRDPQSWLESEINKNLAGTKSAIWRALEAYRYGRYDLGFTEWDAPLATVKNVYPVESYLRYWRDHYDLILKTISLDRLLFVNTHDIETRAREIAEFAQLPPSAVDRSAAHAGIGRRPIRLADTIDPAYVCRVVDDWCGNTYAKLSALAER